MKESNLLQLIPVLLHTENSSKLYINRNNDLCIGDNIPQYYQACSNQYLYLCSDRQIKDGDWYNFNGFIEKAKQVLTLNLGATNGHHRDINDCRKIEFATDKVLILDGVPAIDGNTGALVQELFTDGRTDHTKKKAVNFLEEYCKRYNQKDNPKGTDIDKLAQEELDKINKGIPADVLDKNVMHWFRKGAKFGFTLQSNAGGFSLDDMRNILNIGMSLRQDQLNGHAVGSGEEALQKYILTKEQPKGNIEIWCEMEEESYIGTHPLSGEKNVEVFEGKRKIKLKDRQPIIHFNKRQ